MTGARSFAVIVVTLFAVGCGGSQSPAAPSPLLSHDFDGVVASDAAKPGSVPSANALHTVPFKGRLEGTVTSTPLDPPFTLTEISAQGTATQLGAFTLEMPHTVNLVTRSAEGFMTFTAANRDTLTARFTGQAQGFPILSIVEHATITGG